MGSQPYDIGSFKIQVGERKRGKHFVEAIVSSIIACTRLNRACWLQRTLSTSLLTFPTAASKIPRASKLWAKYWSLLSSIKFPNIWLVISSVLRLVVILSVLLRSNPCLLVNLLGSGGRVLGPNVTFRWASVREKPGTKTCYIKRYYTHFSIGHIRSYSIDRKSGL